MKERLQKILAQAGIGSRRACEELIRQGHVSVNGVIPTLGDSADLEKDDIRVEDEKIRVEKKVYFMLYKPAGYVTSREDEFGRKTIFDILRVKERVFPVGRLDRDAEGLLLLTNDGWLANCLMHPRYEVEKEYFVTVTGEVREDDIERLKKRGIVIERKKVNIRWVKKLDRKKIAITIHEGRKHIVKKLFTRLGYRVIHLLRVRLGPLKLSGVAPGNYRTLTKTELQELTQFCQNISEFAGSLRKY